MSTQANGAAAPDHHDPVAQHMPPAQQDLVVAKNSPDAIMTDVDAHVDAHRSTPMGLRSPPDSDKAINADEASDSELSGLDDDVADKLDQDITFEFDLGSDPLPDSKTATQQEPEPSVSHEQEPAAAAATVENTQVKEEQEGETKESTTSEQPETGAAAASATTPMSPSEEDIGENLPDRFENNVPVFKPTMKQFQDFKLFVCLSSSCAMTPSLAD